MKDEIGSFVLELLLVLPVLLFLTFAGLEYGTMLIRHQMVEHFLHRSLTRMQVDGRLLSSEEERLRSDLHSLGCQDVALTGAIESRGDPAVLRPEEVHLMISCKPVIGPMQIARLVGGDGFHEGYSVRVGGRLVSERIAP